MAQTICGIVNAGYLPASFNGIPFEAVDVSSEHGRRGAEGEFPFGESTAYADLGRRIRTYSISGKIQSDGFLGIAAALIAACELPGPGVLVHPTRGIISAACKSLKVSDKLETEAGITYIDMEFVEGNAWPNGLSLVGSILGLILSGIIGASRDNFKAHYESPPTPVARRSQVLATTQSAVMDIRTQYQKAIVILPTVNKYQILADMNDVIATPTLLADPETADRAIALGLQALSMETTQQAKFEAMRSIINSNSKVSRLSSAFGGMSENAVYSHVRTVAAAYMAEAAMETAFHRRAGIYNAIDSISTVLDDEADIARINCYNSLYNEITNFKLDAQTQLYKRAYGVPGVIDYNFNGSVHPLVAAYSIFNDATRHRELEADNVISATGRIGPFVRATGFA